MSPTANWRTVDAVTLTPGAPIAVYLEDGPTLLLLVTRLEDDPEFPAPGVVPRIHTAFTVALAGGDA